ncbi:hypothetical protein DES53_10259 [Roseimicrobium gellanilyticum]|uniref:Uncharacterized protein n=1 Tax=Roseimicrobium gellanilyticum TaxID=748857 RepID=A0A366HSK1_9BACT|nr:hypothetical protein [Roseimicrobium gellanilyticum]RBP45677.1 hypothetical protein DES53_10259 [Roseimicrobium gellanilyticum]
MSTELQDEIPAEEKKRTRFPVWIIFALLAAVVGGMLLFKKEEHSMNVPLGVEQAAIVTYSGPKLTVTPYKWGVAVNMRIARMTEQDGTRVYDVRYIVNREGTFDLKDYLVAENGSKLDGLPSFKFHGDPKLSKNLDSRIQETEEVRVDVGGHYYATLAGLGVFWILWLLMLIFFRRPKKVAPPPPAPPGPTFAEMLRAYLQQIEAGTLDAEGKAKMEMLLLRRWREDLALGDVSMYSAFGAISQSDKTGKVLRDLQEWLHRPTTSVRREDITALLKPFATP